jgi:hypothetical protein
MRPLPRSTLPSPVTTEFRVRQYRAPRGEGEILSVPPLAEGMQLAEENANRLDSSDATIGSRSLDAFRKWCRQECLEAARQWTARTLGTEMDRFSDGPLYVTGHQPQLAHAGVWVKNMAVSELARRGGGIGLNLIVDNDTVDRQAILVPSGTRRQPRMEAVPFDAPQPQQPWEELRLHDRGLFRTFADRVRAEMASWGVEPVLTTMWPEAVAIAERSGSLVESLSACRMQQERRWGMANLELPVSEMCRTGPFLEFAAHLIEHHQEFHACYNEAVQAYRRACRVRNDRHPVPDLERDGERWELPFWYWKPASDETAGVNRQRVFVSRDRNGCCELHAEREPLARVPAGGDLLAALAEVQRSGRLRTRALTTTLFSRLGLGDLFLHGIGGAKYDEITDRIIERFFEIPAPEYLTLSATLYLPLGAYATTEEEVRRLKRRLRDLRFNADRHLDACCAHAGMTEKQQLIAAYHAAQTAGLSKRERVRRRKENRRRHQRFREVQEKLAELASGKRRRVEAELEEARMQVQANRVLKSREFAAILFPEELLIDLRGRVGKS